MILWTSARHEAGHALAALIEGAEILEFTVIPGIDPERGFYFGYVRHSGNTSWWTDAAPFLLATLTLAAAYLLARRLSMRGRIRAAVVLFGIVSPLADLAYNYQGGFWRAGTDVSELFVQLPAAAVHGFFVLALSLGLMALWRLRFAVHTPRD